MDGGPWPEEDDAFWLEGDDVGCCSLELGGCDGPRVRSPRLIRLTVGADPETCGAREHRGIRGGILTKGMEARY